MIGGVVVPAVVIDAATIRVVLPPGVPGWGEITIRTPNGQTASAAATADVPVMSGAMLVALAAMLIAIARR